MTTAAPPLPPSDPPGAPRPPEELTRKLARKILGAMGENGKPPELGITHVNVGNESYLQLIDRVYVGEVISGTEGSSFKLVQGTYGSGKTHFLYCVRDLAWRRSLLAAFVTISPRECPLNKPLSVYRAVAQRIELPHHEGGDPIRGIDDVLRAACEEKLASGGRDAARAWADAALARAPLSRHSFRDAALRYLRALIDGDEAAAHRLAAWLRGEELPLAQVKSLGVYEVPSNENGFGMLRSLVQAVHRLGHEGTVLLLDEAERRLSVETRPTRATNETIDHLRELVDLCGRSELPRTLILYAVTPAFTQNVLPIYPALQQRLGSPIQYLSPLNPKAPVIDLEALDLEPQKLLSEVGQRLVRVAKLAYDWSPDEDAIRSTLACLTRTVTEEQLEVSHRRLFVKLWIRLLDELRLGGDRAPAEDEVKALVRDEQVQLLEEDEKEPAATEPPASEPPASEPSSEYVTFFGEKVRAKKDPKKRRD